MQKKLLYISVNSKPEELSSSKTVARAFINQFLEKFKEYKVEEVDLYKDHIPRLEYQYFEDRNCIISEEAEKKLSQKEQNEVKRIRDLCDQFVSAQVCVIASPMWSLLFPAPLKEYIDCIVQVGKTITFEGSKKPKGLLGEEHRAVIYIQSSGGSIPWIVDPILDKGENYVESIMKSMGIKQVKELKVDNTGTSEEERQQAIKKAEKQINQIISSLNL